VTTRRSRERPGTDRGDEAAASARAAPGEAPDRKTSAEPPLSAPSLIGRHSAAQNFHAFFKGQVLFQRSFPNGRRPRPMKTMFLMSTHPSSRATSEAKRTCDNVSACVQNGGKTDLLHDFVGRQAADFAHGLGILRSLRAPENFDVALMTYARGTKATCLLAADLIKRAPKNRG
jgi:hypothetical protein